MKRSFLCTAVLGFILWTLPIRAQSISGLVEQLGIRDLAGQYLKPAADAIGYSFNSGLYHTARIDTGFHLYVGVKGMWTLVPEAETSFRAKLPAFMTSLGYPAEVTTATAFGGKGALLHSDMKDQNGKPLPDVQLPDGINDRNTFLFVPHVTFGSILATEVLIRAVPPITLDPTIGTLTFYGGGLKHSPSRYLNLPVDVSLMGAIQQFKIGDVLTVTNFNLNLHASRDLTLLTLYGGIGYEGYTIDASYTYTPTSPDLPADLKSPQRFDFTFTGRNLRFTIGANVEFIPFIDLNIDYSFGVQDNVTLGVGVAL